MIRHTTPRPAPAPAPASRVAWLAEQHAVTTHELSRRLNVPLVELVERLDRAGPDPTANVDAVGLKRCRARRCLVLLADRGGDSG